MGKKVQKLSLEWILLGTIHYHESRDFYKDILGLKIVREVPEEEFTQFQLGNSFLAIYGSQALEKLLGKAYVYGGGGAIYSFAESENIDADVESLKQKGVQFFKDPETQPWGQRTAYFKDPDGHIWEMQQWVNNV